MQARHPDRLYVLSVLAAPDLVDGYEADGWTVFEDPTRAVAAIHAMGRLGDAFAAARRAAPPRSAPSPCRTVAGRGGRQAPAGRGRHRQRAGAGVRRCGGGGGRGGAIGYPVVLKILSAGHRPQIRDRRRAARSGRRGCGAGRVRHPDRPRRRTRAGARLDGVLVAKQLQGGVECILGIHQDPVFGPVAMVGLGGIFVEVLRDVAFRRCPFGPDVAEAMIRGLRGAPLLLGARGRPPADIAALAQMLSRLSAFAAAAGPRLRAVDLNPVLAMPQGAFAVDAVVDIDG